MSVIVRTPDGKERRVDEKVCNHCEMLLPASAFGKNKNYKDGLQPTCKKCINVKQSEQRKIRLGKKPSNVKPHTSLLEEFKPQETKLAPNLFKAPVFDNELSFMNTSYKLLKEMDPVAKKSCLAWLNRKFA